LKDQGLRLQPWRMRAASGFENQPLRRHGPGTVSGIAKRGVARRPGRSGATTVNLG